jgi:hypothetical protein
MRLRPLLGLVLVVCVVCAGCTGFPAAPSTTPDSPPTTASSPSPTSTPTPVSIPAETAGERAIAAEKARIRNVTSAWSNLTDLSFGILRPADYELRRRNASGVVVDVTVGYSTSFTCGPSVDGAATETQYVVTAETVRLVRVEQDVGDPPDECRSPSLDT